MLDFDPGGHDRDYQPLRNVKWPASIVRKASVKKGVARFEGLEG
jgi:hypothetical protein